MHKNMPDMNNPMDMMQFQKTIKDNSTDLQNMVEDLADWSGKMDAQDSKRKQGGMPATGQAKSSAKGKSKPLPPIRNRVDIKQSLAHSSKFEPAGSLVQQPGLRPAAKDELIDKVKRDTTPMPDYYKAWDKIGRDMDEDSSDDNDTGDATRAKNPKYRDEGKSTADNFKPTSGAAPNTTMVVKGARQSQISQAEEFKLQGNAYFVSLDYSKAIECYTRCLKNIDGAKDADLIGAPQEMKKLVLSNRSQAYLKLKAHAKAFDDANRAVQIDPTHVKSIGRRGTASYYLGNVKQAKFDFLNALQLEPENLGFIEYIKKANEKLERLKQEAMDKIERRVMFTDLEDVGFDQYSVRIPVTELHLDQREIAALQKKKEQVVNRQQMDQEARIVELDDMEQSKPAAATSTSELAAKKKNKKKSKRSKNKGLAAFMDGEEMDEFSKDK